MPARAAPTGMMLHRPRSFFLLFAFILLVSACERGGNSVYEKTSRKALPDILEDAEFSITDHNLRVVDRLHIGKAIRDRGNKQFPEYEIILYCSLTFAEKILVLRPDLVNMCPGRISVRGVLDAYIISAPLWPERNGNRELDRMMQEMNGTLKTIVDYAAED